MKWVLERGSRKAFDESLEHAHIVTPQLATNGKDLTAQLCYSVTVIMKNGQGPTAVNQSHRVFSQFAQQ